jgi:hypothetical protein
VRRVPLGALCAKRHTFGTVPAQTRAPFAGIVVFEGGGSDNPTLGGGSGSDAAFSDTAPKDKVR